jgi:hypothetical protein
MHVNPNTFQAIMLLRFDTHGADAISTIVAIYSKKNRGYRG